MSGPAAQTQTVPASAGTEESQSQEDALKTASQQQEKNFQEQVPEIQMGSAFLSTVAGLGLLHISDRAGVINAFQILNDKDVGKNLLDLTPKEFRRYQESQRIVSREFDTQRKRAEKRGQPFKEARVGVWRIRQTMSPEGLFAGEKKGN